MTVRIIRIALVLLALASGYYGLSLIWAMPHADQLSIAFWLAGGLIAHDALFAPACIALGFGAKQLLPQRWWPAALLALAASLIVLILSIPVLSPRPSNRDPDNTTILDRPYGVSVLIALAIIWLLACTIILMQRRTHAAAKRPEE
jgi:hypothetical protein